MSGKRKYSDELRLKVVLEYLSGTAGGYETIAKKHGIVFSMVRRWVHLYELHGVNGLIKRSGSYTGEFKVHVVEYMHEKALSFREASSLFCIPNQSTITKWERIYYEEGPAALMEERRGRGNMGKKKTTRPKNDINANEDLLEEVRRLRMENEYLKKLIALVQERERSEQEKE